MTVDARKERFELVEVLGHPMLFTCLRVDRSTVPKGLYLYEVRNDDDQCGLPVEIGRWVMVNHWARCCPPYPLHWNQVPISTTPTGASTRRRIGTTPASPVRCRRI